MAASASHDKTVYVWPVDGRTESVATLPHPDAVFSVSVSGETLASGCRDGKVRTFSLATFACTRTLERIKFPFPFADWSQFRRDTR